MVEQLAAVPGMTFCFAELENVLLAVETSIFKTDQHLSLQHDKVQASGHAFLLVDLVRYSSRVDDVSCLWG